MDHQIVKTRDDNEKQLKSRTNCVLSVVIVVLLFVLFAYFNVKLFYRQSYVFVSGDTSVYHSDILTYIYIVLGEGVLYDCTYPVLFMTIGLLGHFVSVEKAAALSVCMFNCLSLAAYTWIFYKTYTKRKLLPSFLMALALHFASMFFVSKSFSTALGIPRRYVGVYSPSPWHNGTYLTARPFAIMAFYKFAEIIDHKIRVDKWSDYIWFGAFMLLSAMAKPSFSIPMLVVCGFSALYFLIKDYKGVYKGVLLGCAVLVPTIIDLLYQYRGAFIVDAEQTGDGIAFGFLVSWKVTGVNVPLAILFAGLASFTVLFVYHKWDVYSALSWLLFLVSLFMYVFLYEKGERLYHQNFSWGYMQAMFILLGTSAGQIIRPIESDKKKRTETIQKAVCCLAFSAQVICGIIYFVYIYSGGDYYTF